MRNIRAIIIGILIWILGSSFYAASYLFPFLENIELQADLVLAMALVPNAWFGISLYYKNGLQTDWKKLGAIVLLTAITLDSSITVPFLILPQGGSYQNFFGTPSFWLIAIEYLLIIFLYWKMKVKQTNQGA